MLNIEQIEDIAYITVDDGKANVVSEAYSRAVNEALDYAEANAKVVVIAGRPGRFSAGFDLSVIRDGTPQAATQMRTAGARTMHRIFVHPQPVVLACTGHALAAGALILLAGDTRIGMHGDFKIGLNETAIGLPLPEYALELVKARMPVAQWTSSIIQAQVHSPGSAVSAGYLDQVVAPDRLREAALAQAQKLAGIAGPAYATVKQRLRGRAARAMLELIG